MGLIPSEFNEKDILTLLHKNADFLILMETDYRSEVPSIWFPFLQSLTSFF